MKSRLIDPTAGTVFARNGKPLFHNPKHRYLSVNRGRKMPAIKAHRLIWESVHGPIPVGMEVNHINGDKRDNRIANLELVTPSENIRHAFALGLRRADGERNNAARLTWAHVREIRAQPKSVRHTELGLRYGVCPCTIRLIRKGATWREANEAPETEQLKNRVLVDAINGKAG